VKNAQKKSFTNVTTIFFGGGGGVDHKAENYHDMVADLIQSYKAMGAICFS
jgi:hypothetical protein